MKIKSLIAAVCFLGGSYVFAQDRGEQSFEKAVNEGMESAKSAGDILKSASDKSPSRSDWWTTDCAYFTFGPNDPLVSGTKRLESEHIEKRCEEDSNGHEDCHESTVDTETRFVHVEVSNRGSMYPWEADKFSACLEEDYLSVRTYGTPSHRYEISQKGHREVTAEARAFEKIRANPDPEGLAVEAFIYDTAASSPKLSLTDKWAEWYTGEETVISLKLKRDVPLWFDQDILRKDITFPAARRYEINFADYAREFLKPLEPGKKYYVEWSFKRNNSKISLDTDMPKGQTQRIIQP